MEPPVQQNFLFDVLLPRVEWFAWLLASTGVVLAYFSYPRANIFLFLGFSTLAAVYFLGSFAPRSKSFDGSTYPGETQNIIQGKSFFIDKVVPQVQDQAMATALLGVQFKLLFWTGANTLLYTGNLTLVTVVAIQLYANRLSRKALVVGALGAIVAYIPSDDLVRQFYQHDPVLAQKMLYHLHHPKDKAAAEEVRHLQQAQQGQ
jgi:hypothetical protein